MVLSVPLSMHLKQVIDFVYIITNYCRLSYLYLPFKAVVIGYLLENILPIHPYLHLQYT